MGKTSGLRCRQGAARFVFPCLGLLFSLVPVCRAETPLGSADWKFGGAAIGDSSNYLGSTTVAHAGDVNGDGYGDVIVGASAVRDAGDNWVGGLAYVFHGSATGLEALPAWSKCGETSDSAFGATVCAAGDVNGDGYDDVLISAPWFSGPDPNEGKVYVFLGSASGLRAAPTWTAETNGAYDIPIPGESRVSLFFGHSLASGDLNGDGFSDIVVGTPSYYTVGADMGVGRLLVWYGSASGLGAPGTAANVDWMWLNPHGTNVFDTVGSLGQSVACADVNGDGYDDIIAGQPGDLFTDTNPVQSEDVLVFHGGPGGPAAAPSGAIPNPAWRHFGYAVASAGDVNSDSFDDVILSQVDSGDVSLYLGSAAGITTAAAWTVHGEGYYGYSLASGDANHDGWRDIIVGAPAWRPPWTTGPDRVCVYLGSAGGFGATPSWQVSAPSDTMFGQSVGLGGDVNGDSLDDVLVAQHQMFTCCPWLRPDNYVYAWYGGHRTAVFPAALEFGDVNLSASRALDLSVRNDGLSALHFTGAGLALLGPDASKFALGAGVTTAPLAPSAMLVVPVVFRPTTIGAKHATLRVTTDDTSAPVVDIPLSGTALDPRLVVTAPPLNFAARDVHAGPGPATTVTLENAGQTDVVFSGSGIATFGPQEDEFVFAAGPPSLAPLPPGGRRDLGVAFDPSLPGLRQASLRISTNDSTPTIELPMTGTGLSSKCVVEGGPLYFGQRDTGAGPSAARTAVIRNDGTLDLAFTGAGIALGGADAASFAFAGSPATTPLAPGTTRAVEVVFAPLRHGRTTASLDIITNDPTSPFQHAEVVGLGGRLCAFGRPDTLRLWLSRDDGVVTDSAGYVSRWQDGSGSMRDALQEQPLARPVMWLPLYGDKPALHFGAPAIDPSTGMTTAARTAWMHGTLSLSSSASLLAALAPGVATGTRSILNSEWRLFLGAQDDKFASYYGDGTAWGVTGAHAQSPAMPPWERRVLASVQSGTVVSPFVDGASAGQRANPMAAFADAPYAVGRSSAFNDSYWNGLVSEVLVFDGPLSANERAAVENYLGIRYRSFPYYPPATWWIAPGKTGIVNRWAEVVLNITQNADPFGGYMSFEYPHDATGAIAAGSAWAPDGTMVSPNALWKTRFWRLATNPADSITSITFALSLEVTPLMGGVSNSDRLVILERASPGEAWSPRDTIRVGNTLCTANVAELREYAVGTDAADNPGLASWSSVLPWRSY